jgi:DNA (cytosine-5)-methyltransferase 1
VPVLVIDLFAGPGGLGEGFVASLDATGSPRFRVALSIEKDPTARETLRLRAFFRQFPPFARPEQYYDYLRGEMELKALYDFFPEEAAAADREAWHAELGQTPAEEVDARITAALSGENRWALIGGPPCQAYSVIGRSRVGGIDPEDHRVHLYREYLRILAVHRPAVFVMENVRGILSARLGDKPVNSQSARKGAPRPNLTCGSRAGISPWRSPNPGTSPPAAR